MNTVILQTTIKELIEQTTSNLPGLIKWYTRYNQPVKIIDDTLSEVIGAIMNETLCCGTGGSGWDNNDGGECKNSSHVQSKFCAGCGEKVTYFTGTCPCCKISSEFKGNLSQKNTTKSNPRDGRWGISAKSHIEYKDQLKEYRLTLVEPTEDKPTCRSFRLRYWVIGTDSEHLNHYADAQFKSQKSNHINFQPLKADFYLSKPILKFDGTLDVLEDRTEFTFQQWKPENTIPEPIPKKYEGIDSLEYIQSKKLGKNRGKTGRKKLNQSK